MTAPPQKRLSEIIKLPTSSSGTGEVKFDFSEANFAVEYEYFDKNIGKDAYAKLDFCFAIAISIESETNDSVGLPQKSELLYSFDTNVREGFRGFLLWLNGNVLLTVVCSKVIYGGVEY